MLKKTETFFQKHKCFIQYVGITFLLLLFSGLLSLLTHRFMSYRMGTWMGCLLLCVCTYSTITDYFFRKIYNHITYPAFILVLVLNILSQFFSKETSQWIGRVGIVWALLGCIVCFLVTIIPYTLSQGGAGDVKLAVVLGAGLVIHDGLLTLGIAFIISFFITLLGFVLRYGFIPIFTLLKTRLLGYFYSNMKQGPEVQWFMKQPVPLAPGFLVSLFGILSGSWQLLIGFPLMEI